MWPLATNNDMSVTYKDIDQLSQKSSVAGTEKIPVSDTQYITPEQISGLSGLETDSFADGDLAISDENDNHIVEFSEGHVRTKYFDSRDIPTKTSDLVNDAGFAKYALCADVAAYNAIANKDSGTLYLIPKTS